MVMHSDLRVSDAERNSVAAELREHFVQGRLTLGELKERLGTALTAKTRGQLDRVMSDLPYSPGLRPQAPQPVWPVAARYAALAMFIIVLASWVVAAAWFSHHGYYWYGPGYYGMP